MHDLHNHFIIDITPKNMNVNNYLSRNNKRISKHDKIKPKDKDVRRTGHDSFLIHQNMIQG